MRVALVRVLAGLERDRPGLVAHEWHRRRLVQAGAYEVEIVDRSLVLDLDPVGAGLDRLQVPAVELDLDRVPGTDLAGQACTARSACVAGRRRSQGDSDERERQQKAS